MTIGPDPMTITFLISVLLGIFAFLHQFNEFVKKVLAVLRTRCTFRVILYGKYLVFYTFQSFNGLVKQIDMGGLQGCILETVYVNGIIVILACNFNLASCKIFDGMIAASMSEFQFVGFGSVRQTYQLVSQANTEDGLLSAQFTDMVCYNLYIFRITRTIRHEYSVRIE